MEKKGQEEMGKAGRGPSLGGGTRALLTTLKYRCQLWKGDNGV